MKKYIFLILLPSVLLNPYVWAKEADYKFLYNASELVNNLSDDIYQNSPDFRVQLTQEVDKFIPSLIELHKTGDDKELDRELEILRLFIDKVSLIDEEAYISGNIEDDIDIDNSHVKKTKNRDENKSPLDESPEIIMDNSGHVLTESEMLADKVKPKVVSKKITYLPSDWNLSLKSDEESIYNNFRSSRVKHYNHNFNMVWNQGDMFFAKEPSSSKGIISNIQGEWNHVGMYSEGDIYHAFPDSKGVSVVGLDWWKQYRTLAQVGFSWKLKKPSGPASSMAAYEEITFMVNAYLKSQLHTPYGAFGLKKDHSTQYCSKLVWNALRYAFKDNRWLSEEGRKVDFDSDGGLWVMPVDLYKHPDVFLRRTFVGK